MQNLKRNKKGISLIFTFLLLILVFGSVSISFLAARTNLTLNKRHTSELQVFNELESAKAAALWELGQAGNTWDTLVTDATVDSTPRMPGASIDTYNFYSVSGHSFRVYVTNEDGIINIFIHAYKDRLGSSAPYTYTYSKYAQYRYVPTPLYQYFIFANQKIDFSGGNLLYKVKGGRIHSNKNITFAPTSYYDFPTPQTGIRFSQLTEMTAAETIQYKKRNSYPSRWSLDIDDYYDENHDGSYSNEERVNATTGFRQGMVPAPYPIESSSPSRDHFWTTDNTYVRPGPLAYWCPGCMRNPAPKDEWITGDYLYQEFSTNESIVNAPWVWQGEDYMFYGKQYNGSMAYSYSDETRTWRMQADGSIGNTTGVYVYNFDLNADNSDLVLFNNSIGQFFGANVMFKPYQDALGVNNTNKWIEIPGSLPQAYKWEAKYSSTAGVPVRFYETELCRSDYSYNAGCMVDNFYCATNNTGWRYRKKLGSSYCTNNNCYNNTTSYFVPVNASTTVVINGTTVPYFSVILTDPRDRNNEFFDDFQYGDDTNDTNSPYRDIRAFNIQKQPEGFVKYQQRLTNLGFNPNIIKAGVARKYFDLGQLFDKPGADSAYKLRAVQNGIYIDDSNVNSVKTWLNSVTGYPYVATWPRQFANWRTNQTVSVFDINVGYLKTVLPTLSPNFNGLIYSKVPIRLSSATELPGINDEDRKAVFTVLCEESIYLKGNYNTVNWKLSHLATKKIIYGLSNYFTDPSYRDFKGYNGGVYNGTYVKPWDMWPYVYLKLNTTSGIYWPCEEGTPGVDEGGFWYQTEYSYYLPSSVDQCWTYLGNRSGLKQQEWEAKPSGYYPPNQVNSSSINHYNSLFLTPYNFPSPFVTNYSPSAGPGSVINFQYEDWRNANSYYPPNATVSVQINGSLINLYDTPGDPAGCCDDEYWSACNVTENPFNERNTNYPRASYNFLLTSTNGAPSVTQEYDARLPNAVPKNYQAVLGMTGESVWRQITEDYFHNQTGG